MEEAARRAVWRIHLDGPRLVADVLYLINLMRRGDRMAHRVITDELRFGEDAWLPSARHTIRRMVAGAIVSRPLLFGKSLSG